MAKVNGKNKGNGFERKIANLLSTRFETETGLKSSFRRNSDSGSFFGGTNKQRTETHNLDYAVFGDLITPKNFKFSIECKHYKTAPTFQSLVNHNITMWDSWLKQAQQDATSSNRKMCLIIKYNNVDEIVLVADKLLDIYDYSKYKTWYVYKLTDFLAMPDGYFFERDQFLSSDQLSTNGSNFSGPKISSPE